uniref:Uncharacterized protein n=2 Tax=Micrurus surinamensis TaxID=129470 RepID=A0A2D4PDF7_MICSU
MKINSGKSTAAFSTLKNPCLKSWRIYLAQYSAYHTCAFGAWHPDSNIVSYKPRNPLFNPANMSANISELSKSRKTSRRQEKRYSRQLNYGCHLMSIQSPAAHIKQSFSASAIECGIVTYIFYMCV